MKTTTTAAAFAAQAGLTRSRNSGPENGSRNTAAMAATVKASTVTSSRTPPRVKPTRADTRMIPTATRSSRVTRAPHGRRYSSPEVLLVDSPDRLVQPAYPRDRNRRHVRGAAGRERAAEAELGRLLH